MDNFLIQEVNKPLQIKVNTNTNHKAFTSVFLVVENNIIKPAVK